MDAPDINHFGVEIETILYWDLFAARLRHVHNPCNQISSVGGVGRQDFGNEYR